MSSLWLQLTSSDWSHEPPRAKQCLRRNHRYGRRCRASLDLPNCAPTLRPLRSRDEARRDASNIAKLPALVRLGTSFSVSRYLAPEIKEPTMKAVLAILTLALLAISPAAAESAKSFAPGHHAKGIHGASSHAPGHVKKSLHMQSARGVAPGHMKR